MRNSKGQFVKGNVHTPETLKKLSNTHKGNPGYWTGKKRSKEDIEKFRISHLGHKHSEETKRKMSLFRKGKPTWSKGSKWPEERKRKMSLLMKGRFAGEKHYNWKGGKVSDYDKVRHSLDFKLWRKSVFERDNFTCFKCNIRGTKLHPHHINNFADYPELRLAIDNGVTLCVKCHLLFHKRFGRHFNTKEQLQEFLLMV
jgi:hypothetical protein